MGVDIIIFPVTKVAVIEHHGSPESEHDSVKKLVAWRIENRLPLSDVHRSYGIHYNDPYKVLASDYHVDLCISVEQEVAKNSSLRFAVPKFGTLPHVRILAPHTISMKIGYQAVVKRFQSSHYSSIM